MVDSTQFTKKYVASALGERSGATVGSEKNLMRQHCQIFCNIKGGQIFVLPFSLAKAFLFRLRKTCLLGCGKTTTPNGFRLRIGVGREEISKHPQQLWNAQCTHYLVILPAVIILGQCQIEIAFFLKAERDWPWWDGGHTTRLTHAF